MHEKRFSTQGLDFGNFNFMIIKWILLLTTLIAEPTWQDQLDAINSELAELKDQQQKSQSRINKKKNDAMRWQFQNNNYIDARRAWDQIAREKEILQKIEERIDQLQSQKQEILKKHG